MADVNKERVLLGVKTETTEGTWAEPSAGDYIETNGDGPALNKSRETKERSILTGDDLIQDFRLGMKDIEATIPVEFKAGSAEGVAPEYQALLEAYGFKNQGLANTVTTEENHTTTKIYIASGDVSKFKVNDCILIKEAGAFHVSPIKSISSDGGGDYLELVIACASAPSDGVVIAKSQVLKLDSTQNKTVSIRELEEGGQVSTKLTGGRVSKIDLSSFSVGELASWAFTVMGLNYEEKLESPAISITPAYDTSQPPLILNACAVINGSHIDLDSIELSLERTVAMKTSFCAANGKVSSRGTGKHKVTGKFSPYQAQDALGFTLDESTFDLFITAHNPTNADGEFKETICLYFPRCKATAVEKADKDGLVTKNVSWQLVPSTTNEGPVICFF